MKRLMLVLVGWLIVNCSDAGDATFGGSAPGAGGSGSNPAPGTRTCTQESSCDSTCESSCTQRCVQAGTACDCSYCCTKTAQCYYSHSSAEAKDPSCDAAVCREANGVGTISATARGHAYQMTSDAMGIFSCTRDGAALAVAPSAGGIGGMTGGLAATPCNQVASHWWHCCGW
jgi:hypothetical protein